MNRILGLLLGPLLFFTVGCDPGMSIRQTPQGASANTKSALVIRIATTHQLRGETHYAPKRKYVI